jgi:hypothetical protein
MKEKKLPKGLPPLPPLPDGYTAWKCVEQPRRVTKVVHPMAFFHHVDNRWNKPRWLRSDPSSRNEVTWGGSESGHKVTCIVAVCDTVPNPDTMKMADDARAACNKHTRKQREAGVQRALKIINAAAKNPTKVPAKAYQSWVGENTTILDHSKSKGVKGAYTPVLVIPFDSASREALVAKAIENMSEVLDNSAGNLCADRRSIAARAVLATLHPDFAKKTKP